MRINLPKATTIKAAVFAVAILLLVTGVSFAQQQINLAAGPATATLPDGSIVPMWGYSCGTAVGGSTATCAKLNPTAIGWSPVVVTVPTGQGLQINLTNHLLFGPSVVSANKIPTSLVIVGQLGGGLGTTATSAASPEHGAQSLTWPAMGASGDPMNNPPVQGPRVQSFSTEVGVGQTKALTWTAANLRPGTYLIESGTHPSIQGPMGLYGILVVTTAPTTAPSAAQGTAYPGVSYDADISMLFSEIDPVQNRAVALAVGTSGFAETAVWSGKTGECGDPAVHSCYPPAVNYSPLYYLINGVAFNKTNANASKFPAAPATNVAADGKVLVRMVNAGLRMHVPSIVGSQTGTPANATSPAGFSLIAEDGNQLPGTPRVQSEVFMAAGKTYDVMINVPAAGKTALPIYDRQLSLSGSGRERDAGMLAYISINGSEAPNVPSAATVATADTYTSVFDGQTLTVADPMKGLIANDSNVYSVAVSTGPTHGSLTLQPDGTFTYTPTGTVSSAFSDTFVYCANGLPTTTTNACATVTLGAAPIEAASGITCTSPSFTSNVATYLSIKNPGVLANCKDAAGYPFKVDTATVMATGVTVVADANGGFNATAPTGATPSFKFQAVNAQGTHSPDVTVNLTFPAKSGPQVSVVDGHDRTITIDDYKWIIEEDRTFYVDPKNATNNGTTLLPAFGANFHTSYMPIVAQGCTGTVSCENGQSVGKMPAVCDVGNGLCRTDGDTKAITLPSDVVLDPTKRYYISVLPGDGMGVDGMGGDLGSSHAMGGAPIAAGQKTVQVLVEPLPLPTARVSVMVFEDDFPTNGEQDTGGGVDVLAPNEPGLGGFNITLFDDVGGSGDAAGQMTYDMFGNPLSNALAGTPDPANHNIDACPVSKDSRTGIDSETGIGGAPSSTGITGMITVCPKYEADGTTLSPLAGQALVANLPPGRYGVVATPGADRIAKGEEWLQTNTLDGGAAHDSFIRANEPNYFQEYGPAGYHVAIGFANPAIINGRKADVCAALTGTAACTHTITGKVTGVHMSRTPDERLYSTGTRDTFGYTQCYVSLGSPDGGDFAFEKCDDQGVFTFSNMPGGDWRITVFDQWDDQVVDGISTPVRVDQGTVDMGDVAVHQWKTNLSTSTFFDQNGNGVREENEPGLPLVYTNVRYRDGSFSNFNSTDLNGDAGFNEVFPLFNWYVVETDSTRYKNTGTHVVYDAGGPVDGSPSCGQTGYPACGTSTIAKNLARTKEDVPLPTNLRVPGARYCANADCPTTDTAGGSTGRVDPPWVTSEGWQSFIGQNEFLEFGKRPFNAGENGGIRGDVVYASTRPFDDPALLLQLSWEPQVPNVTVNLYQEGTAPDGSTSLKLVDTTKTSSWDDWAQGFRSDGVPNMNCPGQASTDLFFFTLNNQPMYLDAYNNSGTPVNTIPYNSQFKCFDGMHNWNQLQPAPYDGHYVFPSIAGRNPTTGVATGGTGSVAGTNCTICVADPTDGTPMLPVGKYVVEMMVPPGYELVKEEDKNILMGDTYIAPVTNQFAGFGNIFILPDQATIGETYYGQPVNNPNNPLIPTNDEGVIPRHEGDTGSIETFWPCVGELRTVPDSMSLFPGSGQNAPFAGAKRPLCDRKEVTLEDQMAVLAKFYVFTSTHVAAHFTGVITDDLTAEFDPFSPQFGEKFAPANLPVSVKDWAGNEISRIYADQWGAYNGLTYSSWGVNPPDPSGYVPTMMVTCMNDVGDPAHPDPLYQPQYSQFCYENPFMPGQTQYMDTPVVPTSAYAGAGYNNPDCAYPDATPAIGSVNGDGDGPYIAGTTGHMKLTINALGAQSVINYGYSGPSATMSPFNQKTITRTYNFGSAAGTVSIGGITIPAAQVSWGNTAITLNLTSTTINSIPLCALQQKSQYGGSNARCGQLVIKAANGNMSVDTVTVTIGGKAPLRVGSTQTYKTIQSAIDAAQPGDLIIVSPGTYTELLLMWKPVRLQGVGAASTVINASTHPSGALLDPWRKQINCLFGLTPEGQPGTANMACGSGWTAFDKMHPQVDRIPLEGILGWDATVNGNLAEQLMEPSIMGAYEGAAITVLGKGVKLSTTNPFSPDAFGAGAESGFPADATLLSVSDCSGTYPSNFYCNPSSIDGFGVTNSSQGGGGIFVHAWGHNLQIGNNRVYNNTGTLSGGVTIGVAETPDAYLVGDVVAPGSCGGALLPGVELPFCFDRFVNVHNNAIVTNSSIGDELFSSTASGAGGISFSPGSDGYKLTGNWVCGNLSTGDGGGVVHLGYSENGLIEHNSILFNQSTNPTIPANGGGIAVMTAAPDGAPPNSPPGTECGSVTDVDCGPGLGDGTGPGLVINANLIMGNAAEAGSGGGIRLQGVNGTEVSRFPILPGQWYQVDVTNNIIVNNVAGWDGAGVSLVDSLKVNLVNNTIASNDSTASSGALFTTFRAQQGLPSAPIPGCTTPRCLAAPQPAGVATEPNSAGLIASLPGTIICPAGHSTQGAQLPSINGDCRKVSYPELYNNLIWQNRAFNISVGAVSSTYQQSVISLTPTLNQTKTGECVSGANYWDIGVRGDTGPTNHTGTGVTLTPVNSVLTSTSGYTAAAQNNSQADPDVSRQYCNGSRIPPEFGGSGYNVPPGTNEGNVPTPIFNLAANATVDEGNNWINISWGPLAIMNPTNSSLLGNYGLAAGSPSIDYITSGTALSLQRAAYNAAPPTDFFGNPRKNTGNPNVDVGAIEGAVTTSDPIVSVSPTNLAYGNVAVGGNRTQTLTVTNGTGSDLTGITVSVVTTSPASNVFTRNGGTCTTTLAAGTNCTIIVQFAPTAAAAYTGTATITGSAGVIGSPVALSGTGFAKPALNLLDNFNRANANTLGANWQQLVTLGAAGIRVNENQALCNAPLLCATVANAYWNASFGVKQGAAFTITNTTLNNDSVILSATGSLTLGAYADHIRVLYNGGVTVATTTNGGLGYTTAGSVAGSLANGDIITALLDGSNTVNGSATPTVSIWRTRAGTDTFIGTVSIPSDTLWQSGGRIGMQLPSGAAVDNYAGGNVP
jgi:Abnormal spindle-like microcephaly-assoc'd, ASPM-SPD-2-Hydin/Bacterial cadherin-like domain